MQTYPGELVTPISARSAHQFASESGQYVSRFIAKKLDIYTSKAHSQNMGTAAKDPARSHPVMRLVRHRIERGGERLWRFSAVAQALSRLTRQGTIERLSKGVYYRNRETVFGKSRPNPAAIRDLASRQKALFPSGIAAANLLGFTTQMPKQGEIATSALSLPRKLVGNDTLIHTRRPEAWASLSETDAALLDFLRYGGKFSELSQEDTIHRLSALLSEQGRLSRLLKVADSEPPRVRAMLGALSEQLGTNRRTLQRLRASLNSLSRFDFGMLTALPNASNWQAKEKP
jgi:Family of unknown function (DUF6088)